MIEFKGHISGSSKKHFQRKSRIIVQNALFAALLIFLPIIILVAVTMRYMLILAVYCIMFAIIPLLARIPQSKREGESLTPRNIIIDGKRLTCIADKYTETKWVSDVKLVIDFGEFYEVVFPFGKMSEKFICQKDLLTKGSLGEFERLFKDKLVKK